MIYNFDHINQSLIESLGGLKNIVTYNAHGDDIYILIKNIKFLNSRYVDFDSYGMIWINDHLLNIKVTFDTKIWIKEFNKLFMYKFLNR